MNAPFPQKIWIVDDDLVAQFNTRIKIRQASLSCNVYCFDNAHDALVELMDPEEPGRAVPDIIILDLSMSGMEGWDFLNQLSIILNKESYPNIFLSSSSRVSGDVDKAKRFKMVKGYYVKPLTPQNMIRIFAGTENLREV